MWSPASIACVHWMSWNWSHMYFTRVSLLFPYFTSRSVWEITILRPYYKLVRRWNAVFCSSLISRTMSKLGSCALLTPRVSCCCCLVLVLQSLIPFCLVIQSIFCIFLALSIRLFLSLSPYLLVFFLSPGFSRHSHSLLRMCSQFTGLGKSVCLPCFSPGFHWWRNWSSFPHTHCFILIGTVNEVLKKSAAMPTHSLVDAGMCLLFLPSIFLSLSSFFFHFHPTLCFLSLCHSLSLALSFSLCSCNATNLNPWRAFYLLAPRRMDSISPTKRCCKTGGFARRNN